MFHRARPVPILTTGLWLFNMRGGGDAIYIRQLPQLPQLP